MLLTAWCVAVALGAALLTGVPVAWFLNGRRPLEEPDWVLAPFLGLSAAVLALQNLVYLNLPVRWTAPALWLAVLAGWLWMARRGGLAGLRGRCPWLLLAAALLVFLVQGAGLLVVGPRDYVARAWSDQFNYTAMAQFLCDVPFHTPADGIGRHAYMAPIVLWFKNERIGQSVLQAFLMVSSGLDAKALFQPTILLGPALTVFAVYGLGRRFGLGRWMALITAAAAGLCPALASLQLECFLSQTLAIPFLLVLPLLLDDVNERASLRALGRAALVLAAVLAIYTEIWVLCGGVMAVGLALTVWRHPRPRRLLAGYAALAAAPLALNPGFTTFAVRMVLRRALVGGVLSGVYPWAYTSEGLARLWVGDWVEAATTVAASRLLRGCAVGMTGLAAVGLVTACLGRLRGRDRRGFAFASMVLALACVPLLILLRGGFFPYQYYKLLMTVTPLLFLGPPLLFQPTPAAAGAAFAPMRLRGAAGWSAAAVMLVVAAAATAGMALATSRKEPCERSNASLMYARDMRALQRRLPALPAGNLVFAFRDTGLCDLLYSWFSYFGRPHRIWAAEPLFVDTTAWKAAAAGLADFRDLPDDVLLLTEPCPGVQSADMGGAVRVWSGERFSLWRSADKVWAAPLLLTNPNGIEGTPSQPLFWLGADKTTLDVLAGQPGVVTLEGAFDPGPSLPAGSRPTVRVTAADGQCDFTTPAAAVVSVPIPAGRSRITLEVLDRPLPGPLPSGDTRTLSVLVQGLSFRYEAGPR